MQYLLERIHPALPSEDDRQWEWDWKKYYQQPEVLSTDLHDRFNSHTLPIRRPDVFHREVEGCIEVAATEEEFLAKLEERKAQHVQEVMRAWKSLCAVIESNSWLLASPDQDGEQDTDKENVDKETVDHENADKDEGDRGGEDNYDEEGYCDHTKNDSDKHEELAARNDCTSANLSASPRLGSSTSPNSSILHLDDITSKVVEGRNRWAKETCAGILQQRRTQRLAAPTASARTTAEITAPGSLFSAGIWDPDGLQPSSNLPWRPSASQNQVQPTEPTPAAESRSNNPLKRPRDDHQQGFSEQSPSVTEAEVIALIEIQNIGEEGSGLTEITEPSLGRNTIHLDDAVREVSPSMTSSREPMEIDAGEEDEDVIMTDAALIEHPAPRKSRTAPRASRRQDKQRGRDGKVLRGKRSTPLQEQQSRVKKKQSRRRPSQGTKSPALLDRLLRSTRSSRRDPGHELWYLGDDATACPVTNAG